MAGQSEECVQDSAQAAEQAVVTEARLRAIELQLEDLRERINTTVAALKRIQQHVDLPDWRDA